MGGLYSKLKDYYSTTVDYGYLKPQGIYRHNDYDMKIVKQLIRKGSLAPFYRGTTDIYSTKKISFETECPICFLFYPSNINKTRCCHKSICTECFLQFKRSSSSPLIPAVCPFCVQPNLGVVYLPPPWSKHYDKLKQSRPDLYTTKKIEPDDPSVIYVDTIRPKWEEMLDDASSSAVGSTRRRRVPLTNEIRRRRRRTDYDETIYDTSAELDLEDVLVMEAIRLSLTHNTN